MNSLEFINLEIEYLQDMISMDLALVEDEFDLQEIGKKQKRLKVLQQIKDELEALYVIKPRLRKEKYTSAYFYMNSITKDHPDYRVVDKVWKVKKND